MNTGTSKPKKYNTSTRKRQNSGTTSHPDWNKNKRRLAWTSFISLFIVMILIMSGSFCSETFSNRLKELESLIMTILCIWGAIPLAYIGASTSIDKVTAQYIHKSNIRKR